MANVKDGQTKKEINLLGLKVSLLGKAGLQVKLTFIFAFLLVVLCVINFFLSYAQAISTLNERLGNELLGIARTTAQGFSPQQINDLLTLKEKPQGGEEVRKKLKEIRGKLQQVRSANQVDSMYILVKRGKLIYPLVETPLSTYLGSSYPLSNALSSAFSGEATFIKQLVTSSRGLGKSAYAPLFNQRKEVVGIIGVDAAKEEIIYSLNTIKGQAIVFLLFGIALSVLISLLVARAITNPISQLLAGIERITRGDLTYKVKVKNFWSLPGQDEIGDLAVSFNQMTQSLGEKNRENKLLYEEINELNRDLEKRIRKATYELKQINSRLEERETQRGEELKLASQIQEALLPHYYRVRGVNIESKFIPAAELGGDFYNFIPVDPNHLGIIIGDVTGKGVPAALLMAMTVGILHESSKKNLSPADVLGKANATMQDHIEADLPSFASAFYALLDLDSQVLTYSKAGHESPILYRNNSDCRLLEAEGSFLGAFKDTSYEEKKIQLIRGDKIIFYTDGVTSAQDKEGERFGEKRIRKTVEKNGNLKAKELLEKIYAEVTSFQEGSQSDDLALVVVEIKD